MKREKKDMGNGSYSRNVFERAITFLDSFKRGHFENKFGKPLSKLI